MARPIKFYLETAFPVAVDSYDYLYPLGAIRDNSRNPSFNQKVYRFPGAVLDLGCAGGGFVKNCLEDQRDAVGLEGNNYDKKHKLMEWATIPENLFTCDITKPFTVHIGDKVPYNFGIVTAWEVMEHILEEDLPPLFDNIRRHLAEGGIFVCTIHHRDSLNRQYNNVNMHRTIKELDWWLNLFSLNGFRQDTATEQYFGSDWVRPERASSHLVFRKNGRST